MTPPNLKNRHIRAITVAISLALTGAAGAENVDRVAACGDWYAALLAFNAASARAEKTTKKVEEAYAGLPDASDGGQAFVDAMKALEDSATFKAGFAEHEKAVNWRFQARAALDDAKRAVRSTVNDDEAAAATLDHLQSAVDAAYEAAMSAAYWRGTRRSPPSEEEIPQRALKAWTALVQAYDAALVIICTSR